MPTEESEQIPLSRLEMQDRSLDARLLVDERGKSTLEVVAYDHSTEEVFVGCLDRHQFLAFKDFPAECDAIIEKLNTCSVVMPTAVVANPMTLKIEIGRLELQNESIGCSLSIDRARATEVMLSCCDHESDGLVLLRLDKTDFRRLKDWFAEIESRLAELCKSGYISRPFAG